MDCRYIGKPFTVSCKLKLPLMTHLCRLKICSFILGSIIVSCAISKLCDYEDSYLKVRHLQWINHKHPSTSYYGRVANGNTQVGHWKNAGKINPDYFSSDLQTFTISRRFDSYLFLIYKLLQPNSIWQEDRLTFSAMALCIIIYANQVLI